MTTGLTKARVPHFDPKGKVCIIRSMTTLRRTLKRREVPGHARYLTFSCYHRLPLFQNDRIKQLFVDQLDLTRQRLSLELYAWVVMPEHVHLLVMPDTPTITISHLLRALKRPVAARVLDRWRQLDAAILKRVLDAKGQPHFWQPGGGYDRNIFSDEELLEKIDYIHANPVRRGLVDRTTDWPWSSALWYDQHDGLAMDALPV